MEKLQRQRALLEEHLRWIESEIAVEASILPNPERPVVRLPVVTPIAPAPSAPVVPESASALEPPEANVQGLHNEVRSGCLLYFTIAFVVLGLVVALVYWRY